MPEFEVTVDFEVFCATCGAGLCGNSTVGNTPRRGMRYVQVLPCETCIDNALDEGRDRGYRSGYDDGYENGRKSEEAT